MRKHAALNESISRKWATKTQNLTTCKDLFTLPKTKPVADFSAIVSCTLTQIHIHGYTVNPPKRTRINKTHTHTKRRRTYESIKAAPLQSLNDHTFFFFFFTIRIIRCIFSVSSVLECIFIVSLFSSFVFNRFQMCLSAQKV